MCESLYRNPGSGVSMYTLRFVATHHISCQNMPGLQQEIMLRHDGRRETRITSISISQQTVILHQDS